MTKQEIKNLIVEIINDANDNITADQIYQSLVQDVDPGRTQETIRGYIRELVNDDSQLIGSSNSGYFKINTGAKAQIAISYLLNRIPDLRRRANNLQAEWNRQNPNNLI